MNELRHFDLVTIGGGLAGLCTAVRSAELGLRTAVLEAGTDENYPCSSRWAGGIFHVSYHDVKLSPDQLLAAINRQTSGETDEELAAAIAADAGRTVDWLANQGAAFTQGSPISWHRYTLAPPLADRLRFPRFPSELGRRGNAHLRPHTHRHYSQQSDAN